MSKKIVSLFLIFSLLLVPNASLIVKSMALESIDNSYVEFNEEKFTFPLIVVKEDYGEYKFRNIEDECRKKGLHFIVLTEKKDRSFQCDVYIFMGDKYGNVFKEYKVTLLPKVLDEKNVSKLFDKKDEITSFCVGVYQANENEVLGFFDAQKKLVAQKAKEAIEKKTRYTDDTYEYVAAIEKGESIFNNPEHKILVETIQKKRTEDPDFNIIFDYIEYKQFLKISLVLQDNLTKAKAIPDVSKFFNFEQLKNTNAEQRKEWAQSHRRDLVNEVYYDDDGNELIRRVEPDIFLSSEIYEYLNKSDIYCSEFTKFADKISNLNMSDVKEGLKNYYYNNHFVFFTLKGMIKSRIVNKEETKLFCEKWDELFLSDSKINSLEEKDEYIKNLNEIMDSLNFIKEDEFLAVIAKQINKGIKNLIQELKLSQEVIVERENPDLDLKGNVIQLEFDGKILPIIYKKHIGGGAFGEVYCCWDIINRREIVVKRLDLSSIIEKLQDIPNSLLNIDCPYLAKILGVIPSEQFINALPGGKEYADDYRETSLVSVIMERVRKSHLLNIAQIEPKGPYPFYDIQKIEWAIQLTEGLKAMSDRGFFHKDLLEHTGNILVDKSKMVKIIDYEDAVQVGKDEAYKKNFYNAFCNIAILFSPDYYAGEFIYTDIYKGEKESGEKLVKKLFQKLECDSRECVYGFKFFYDMFRSEELLYQLYGRVPDGSNSGTIKLVFKDPSKQNLDYLLKTLRELKGEYEKIDPHQREMSTYERFCKALKI